MSQRWARFAIAGAAASALACNAVLGIQDLDSNAGDGATNGSDATSGESGAPSGKTDAASGLDGSAGGASDASATHADGSSADVQSDALAPADGGDARSAGGSDGSDERSDAAGAPDAGRDGESSDATTSDAHDDAADATGSDAREASTAEPDAADASTGGDADVGCPSGTTSCDDACVDETTSAASCGGCGPSYACAGGMTCQSSRCACPAGSDTCGGSTCIDLMAADSNNCGACGHGCLGGACSAGKCQPYPLAGSGGAPQALWVDATAIYSSANAENTGPEFIAFDKSSGAELGGAGGYGVTNPITGSIAYYGQNGCPCQNSYWTLDAFSLPTLADANPFNPYTAMSPNAPAHYPLSIAASGSTLAWVDGYGGLYVGNVGGDSVQPLAAVETSTAGNVIVSDGAGFVWTETLGGFRASPSSSLSSPVPVNAPGSGPPDPERIVIDATNIYWFDESASTIYRVPRDGSSSAVIMVSPASAAQLALDASSVYWSDSALGTIESVPKNVTAITTPAVAVSGLTAPAGVAVDSQAYYWGSGTTVYRLAR